jgi:ketosteroid isomerase-like protein
MSASADSAATRPEFTEFSTLLEGWAAAIVANDADRIAEYATPDWMITGPSTGPGTLAGFLALVRSGELTHSAMAFTVLEVRVRGEVAVVLAHSTNQGTWRGESFASDEWVTDVFFRMDGSWRCTMSALTPNDRPGAGS